MLSFILVVSQLIQSRAGSCQICVTVDRERESVSWQPPCRMELQQQPLDLSVRNKIFENYEIYDENEPINLTKSNNSYLLKCPSSFNLYCDISKTEEEYASSFTSCGPFDLPSPKFTLHQPFSGSETFWSSSSGTPNAFNLNSSHYAYNQSPFTDITNISNHSRSSPMKKPGDKLRASNMNYLNSVIPTLRISPKEQNINPT